MASHISLIDLFLPDFSFLASWPSFFLHFSMQSIFYVSLEILVFFVTHLGARIEVTILASYSLVFRCIREVDNSIELLN